MGMFAFTNWRHAPPVSPVRVVPFVIARGSDHPRFHVMGDAVSV